uniref:Purple acid phosphatase n=1 Tax=Timema poppense TaxID=170557 RepID=A0A7R9CMW8_TIMPO|nr:unnamed protein product [Timema poppensis]
MKILIVNVLQFLFFRHACSDSFQPDQIHISYGDEATELIITWSTGRRTEFSCVEYGLGNLELIESAFKMTPFRKQYIHRVKLTNLKPNSVYAYHCGSEKGWSPVFWFKTRPPGNSWSPALAVYGDLGYHNARSLPHLQNEVQRGFYDAVIHAGDFAYDMNDEEGNVGDKFLRQIESMAGYIPYMTCPGNHEANKLGLQAELRELYLSQLTTPHEQIRMPGFCHQFVWKSVGVNFSDYRNRFSMPGNTEGLWYSFDVGPIHFISISTEVYYFLEYGFELLTRQFNWLKEDLKKATKPSNRALRPWIIVYGHRPMYCSNKNIDDCTMNQTRTRIGTPDIMNDGLEDMFYNHGVDLEIWAHEHSYERLWPIYNYQIYNGSLREPYRNPGAPVHVITGSAGCDEKHDPFKSKQPYWSAFRSVDYGYNRLKVFNSTHLYMEYVSVEHHGVSIGRSRCTNSQYRSTGGSDTRS